MCQEACLLHSQLWDCWMPQQRGALSHTRVHSGCTLTLAEILGTRQSCTPANHNATVDGHYCLPKSCPVLQKKSANAVDRLRSLLVNGSHVV